MSARRRTVALVESVHMKPTHVSNLREANTLMHAAQTHRLTKWLLILGFTLAAGLAARGPQVSAAEAAAALPKAADLIARYLKEIGGEDKVMSFTSSHESGTLEIAGQGLTGTFDIYSAKPDKFLLKITLGPIGTIQSGYDGKVGWSLNPFTGPQLIDGKQLTQLQEESDFYPNYKLGEKYTTIETVEKTTYEGQDCYKVRLVSKSGREIMEYFAVDTGLIVGTTSVAETEGGSVPVSVAVSDYKKFDGVLMATKTIQKAASQQLIFTLSAVEHNAVKDDTFALPAEVKALIKG